MGMHLYWEGEWWEDCLPCKGSRLLGGCSLVFLGDFGTLVDLGVLGVLGDLDIG